jgi:hypothetical protein
MTVGRPRNQEPRVLIAGPWNDMGHGICSKCGTERRLYSPVMLLDLLVCAQCSQGATFSRLPNGPQHDRLPTTAGECGSDEIPEPAE